MALTLESFGVSVAVNVLICLTVFLFFGWLRKTAFLEKFYAPKRFARTRRERPEPLPRSLWGWIPKVLQYTQDDVVELAGYDAAMYLRILALGIELFTFVSLWVIIVVLPTNLSGRQVEHLIGRSAVEPSNFTYWIPPPPPLPPPGVNPPAPNAPPRPIKAPDFYASVPPAPPGLEWWHYRPGVPPLPHPSQYFHNETYKSWGWRYDQNFQVVDYTFSKLDLTTMANISGGDQRLWVHLLSAWVISWFVWRLLWRYNREAVALRIAFFMSAEAGGVAHTVLVRDVPGLPYGTVAARIEDTALRFLPHFVKKRLVRGATVAHRNVLNAVDTVLDLPSRATNADASVHGPPVQGIVSAASGGDAQLVRRTSFFAKRHSSGRERPATAPLDPREVVTEVDAWGPAERALESGLSPKEMVELHFQRLFAGDVLRVHMAYDTRKVDGLASEYLRVRQKLLDLLDPTISHKDRKEDKVEFDRARLQDLVGAIRAATEELRRDPEAALPAAFVTFHTRAAQAVASTSLIHHDRTAWIASAAPEPRDVIWGNLGWRLWERQLRAVLCWVVFFCMIAFYLPVVTAIQALLQIDKLVDLPGIREVAELPLVSGLLAGFLPQLVLRLFFSLMPYILALLGRMEGLPAESEVEWGAVRKYFSFQVVTIFLATFVAGSFLNQVQLFISAPKSILRILGAAAPQTASFFMSYLLLLGLTTKPILFLRIPQLLMFWVGALWSRGERARARLWMGQYIDYGYEIPDNLMAVLLGLTFCVISPLIAPVALLFFIVNNIVGRYQLVYVYAERFQSGGKVWREVSGQVYFAVLTFQLVMVALLALKQAPIVALLAAPLPVLTVALWRSAEVLFGPPQEVLSLEAAADLDRRDQEHEAERRQMIEHGEFLESMYEAPPFRTARWDAASLPTEAAAVASGANRMGPAQDLEAQADSELPMMDDDDLYMDLYTEEFIDRKETAVQGSSRDKDEELPLSTPLLKRSSH
ncbi:hypothetical protein WJX75_009706 [Coccomyxa subellipsoidea]|uniref:DUF221-domain-containing protein n=1 Tax=Coccomyxa subellipsoidea TaxID=248742 RepID=A0ABR2Z4K8_9CHLO